MSNDLFRLIFDNTYQFIALLDPQGRALEVNQTALAFAGVTLEEIVGRPAWETPWFPDEARPSWKEAVAQAAQGNFVRYEMDIVGTGAQVMTIDFSLRPVENQAGEITHLIAEGRDITERKQVERALRESESRFSTLFYASPVPVILTTLAEGRFIDLNAEAELILGFSREEVIGRTTTELGLWSERPGGRGGTLRQLDGQGRLRDIEMVLRRKDGEQREVLVSFELLEGQGEQGLLTTLVDLTERKRMERHLRASEARFRSAFHNAAVGMAMTALDGRFLEVNASVCRMLGYSREELLAQGYQQVTHPEDIDTNVRNVEQVLAGELETFQMEKRYLHKEGRVVWGHVSLSAVREDGGSVAYFISQVQDITARKHYEAQVRVMAYRDELTGLHNRRYFFEQAPERLALAQQGGRVVALIYIDLNGFKGVNDTLGHQAGDELLKHIAQEFGKELRKDDLFARFGGDEFVALLSNTTEVEARRVAERLTVRAKCSFFHSSIGGDTGASIGVVLTPKGVTNLNFLLKQADRAMYRAKGRKENDPCAIEVVRLGSRPVLD